MKLAICLLGPPGVNWDGHSLPISRRQVRALLYCLAEDCQPVSRQQLCDLLLPGHPESVVRRRLTHLLAHLRRALPARDIVQIPDDHIQLAHGRVQVDTVALHSLAMETAFNENIETSTQLIELYRGPFLNGFELPANPKFDTWIACERQHWELLYLETLAILVEKSIRQKKLDAAIMLARQYLLVDELAEDMHYRLIELYAVTSNRRAALRQFDHCRTVLNTEFGLQPTPKTLTLYEAVRRNWPLHLQPRTPK